MYNNELLILKRDWQKGEDHYPLLGHLAQSGERFLHTEEVTSSILVAPTIYALVAPTVEQLTCNETVGSSNLSKGTSSKDFLLQVMLTNSNVEEGFFYFSKINVKKFKCI